MKRLILWLAARIERREFSKAYEHAEPVEILPQGLSVTWKAEGSTLTYTSGNGATTYRLG